MVTSFVCACNEGRVAPSHLCSRHCSNFFRADACDVSSIQASQHQKMGLRGNNCGRLDFNCDDRNSLSVNTCLWKLATTIGISFVLMARSYCCLCLIVICVSYTSIALKFWCGTRPPLHGAANRQRKLTVTLFIINIVSLLLRLSDIILTFLSLSVIHSLSFPTFLRLKLYFILLYHTNSLVNPIIHTIRMPEFRRALLVSFKRRQGQNPVIPLQAR